jgi:glycosyltransferase involved in cell wall biosynthesis
MKVSVVIPVFNNEATVGRAIDSALAQQFDGGFEVIVVNDGSTDGTRAVMEKFGDRIAVIDQPRRGVSAARNAGTRAAAGDYVALLDADDEWTEDKLAKTVPVLEHNPSCVAVFSNASVVQVPGRILPPNYVERGRDHSPTLDELLNPTSWPILPSATVARRATLIEIGGFSEEFGASDYFGEDTFAFLLMRERGEMVFVPENLVRYRMPEWEGKLTKRMGLPNFNCRYLRDLAEDPRRCLRGHLVFARLMRERFGARGRELANAAAEVAGGWLVMLGMMAMHQGDRGYARRCYRASLRHRPLMLKTYFRLAWSMLPAKVARTLSAMLSPEMRRSLSGPPVLEEWPQ